MKHVTLRAAFLDTLPVMTGYLFLGFGFGILMQQNGMGIAGGTIFYMLLVQLVFWAAV